MSKKGERLYDGLPWSEYLDKWERDMLAQLERKPPKPKPAEVVPGPWPRPKLTEAEIIAKQQQLDYWWEQRRLAEAQRRTEPTPDQKLTDWIWGRDR